MMYFDDHNPPHFHARYGEYKGAFSVENLNMISGDLPAKVRGLVLEWAEIHQDELRKEWQYAQTGQELFNIQPLV